jgi:hypothetical protein
MKVLKVVLGLVVIAVAVRVVAETPAQKTAFEVVSIKARTSSNPFGTLPINITGGRFVANDNTLNAPVNHDTSRGTRIQAGELQRSG